jgi:hypothetical protein
MKALPPLFALLCGFTQAMAQTPAAAVARELIMQRPLDAARPAAVLVHPGPASAAVAAQLRLEQRTLWVPRDEDLVSILTRSGVSANAETLQAIRKLNPHIGADGRVKAGTRLSFYAPHVADGKPLPAGTLVGLDMAQVARSTVTPHAAAARQLKVQTSALPAAAYERSTDIAAHRHLIDQIDRTAQLVEEKSPQMSARDLALSRFYLAHANVTAQSLTGASAAKRISTQGVVLLQQSVSPLEGMQAMMLSSDKPFGDREVSVSVSSANGPGDPPRLRVYMLPGGILDRPDAFSFDEVRDLLIQLTFQSLTSPSSASVPIADMRVWVGPDHAYDAMARKVLSGDTIRFTPLRSGPGADKPADLAFTAPTDIVVP